ncbi:thioredoxin domain-containing protein 3 homolog isoform X1 [Xiphophorus couchianus]|uniref:thioredoxin domain-containing protein 3 homolog isoform X1 n=1 Tax=Xiphophorus couchianus TaxID=32473 RepID=UPI00101697C3|nr:thioredoxin domain-containing protein 3 homolog isoform X1 [Xiphophorus couchianus]
MAGKKKEASLQASVMNQEQWEEILTTKGLTVVDVYQQWCGPCRAVVSLLRKIKNELSDDLLHFATAEADSIDALEKYRGKCEPTFLFFGGGELVAVLRGANAPMLQRMIVEELVKEKLVMEKGSGRKVVKDFGLLNEEKREEEELQQPQNEESIIVPASKAYTVAIIKPDAVAHGKANEIIMKIQDAGFEILAHEERTLTETEARDFYQHKAAEACFEDLVQFMSSGPSYILVLSQIEGTANIISAWREFIGPADIEEARREKPESIPGKDPSSGSGVGSEQHILACLIRHTQTLCFSLVEHQPSIHLVLSSSFPTRLPAACGHNTAQRRCSTQCMAVRTATRPTGSSPSSSPTLGRPPTQSRMGRKSVWRGRWLSSDPTLPGRTEMRFWPRFTSQVSQSPFKKSGPVLALALVRKGAVHHWKNILGPPDLHKAKEEDPECLRAKFAVENEPINQLHGSANPEEAERELNFFFPQQRTLAVIKPDALEEHRDTILEEIQGRGFTVAQLKETLLSREMAEEFYKEQREKPFFTQLVDFMCRGPCMMLVLTKENAVEEWRAMMGPSNPEKAKEISPQSLRARFAADILHNSVHGSSNEQHAEEKIRFVFGDISADAAPADDSETSRTTSAEWPGGSGDENKGISRSTTEET